MVLIGLSQCHKSVVLERAVAPNDLDIFCILSSFPILLSCALKYIYESLSNPGNMFFKVENHKMLILL